MARADTIHAFDKINRLIASPPGESVDKQFWASLAENDYEVPEGYTLENLTEIVFSYLASTDPDLRDEIAYTVYANWLKQERYSPEIISSHVEKLLADLEKGIGETESDTVFLRAFAILLLAEIVHNDNKKPLLDKSTTSRILEKGSWYLTAEKDPRGYIPVKGWAHALAHTADLLLVLGRNRNVQGAGLWSMLMAISNKMIHATNHVYIHGEDERLAAAVIEILRRDLVSLNQLEIWARSFREPDGKDWKSTFLDEERNRAFQNTRSFLRSIYFALLNTPADFPDREAIIHLLHNTLTELKPK
jgi:hypothetical protein